MLLRRILTAAVLVPLALAGLFLLSVRDWAIASGLFVLVGAWEWSTIAGWGTATRAAFTAAVAATFAAVILWVLPAAGGFAQWGPLVWGIAVAFWVFAALPWLAMGWHVRSPILLALTGWWVLVPAWLAVVAMQPEPGRLLVILATIWVADSCAYFVGRRFGRHKLAPRVSPGKSREGVAGALAGVAVYFAIVEAVSPGLIGPGASPRVLLFLEVMVVLSIVGDLFESWMKREAGVKDSGWILPGHGGVLDRIDSLTSALPAAALFAFHSGGGAVS